MLGSDLFVHCGDASLGLIQYQAERSKARHHFQGGENAGMKQGGVTRRHREKQEGHAEKRKGPEPRGRAYIKRWVSLRCKRSLVTA